MPFCMAASSVGHSADGSVAETISAFAPLVIAAWMAGIWEAGVAAVPLVSAPVSPSVPSAASAPPDPTLSAVVKYGLPRFFGMTNTFRPVFTPPGPAVTDGVLDGDELPPEEVHAASMAVAAMSTAGPSSTRMRRCAIVESFQSGSGRDYGWLCGI